MKLSDAIALGRVLVKPKANFLVDGEGSGCALGMALTAVGKKIEMPSFLEEPEIEWPWLKKVCGYHFCSCFYGVSYSQAIAHIFDGHVMKSMALEPWTLDRLIDWVRSVEPKESKKRITNGKTGRRREASLAPAHAKER